MPKSFTKDKKEFIITLGEKQVSDNKVFWKNVKPLFGDKGVKSSKVTLVRKNSFLVDENKITNTIEN